mgnify:FL=1
MNCVPSVFILFNTGKIGKDLIRWFLLQKPLIQIQISFGFDETGISENYFREDESF